MCAITNITDEQLNKINGGFNSDEILAKECPNCHSNEHVKFLKDYDPSYSGTDVYICTKCNVTFK